MSPVLRSFRRRGRWVSKNGSYPSGRVKSQKSDSSPGKKSVPSYHSVPSAEPSDLASSSGRNTKEPQVSGGDRRITRASARSIPSIITPITPQTNRTIKTPAQTFEVSKPFNSNGNRITAEEKSEKSEKPEKAEKPENSEQRVLRPRGSARVNLSQLWGRKPFVDVKLLNGDSMSILRRRIKVWWPLDSRWYYGYVKEYDSTRDCYWVVYDDGDEEWLDLSSEHCKLQLRPGQLLDLARPPGGKRPPSAALESCKSKSLRAEGEHKTHLRNDRSNAVYEDQTVAGDGSGAAENPLQEMELVGEGRVGNGDVGMNGNRTSSSRNSFKQACAYARRRSRKNEKPHGPHPISEVQPTAPSPLDNVHHINLSNRDVNLHSLVANAGCSMQELEIKNDNKLKVLPHSEATQDLVGCGLLNLLSSCEGCAAFPSNNEDEATLLVESDAIVPHSGVYDDANKEATKGDAEVSKPGMQISVKPLNQKAKRDLSSQRRKGIHASGNKYRDRYEKPTALPGRYTGVERSFLQSFHFDLPEHFSVALKLFRQQLNFLGSIPCEDTLKGSFTNPASTQTLTIKQSLPKPLTFDSILCVDGSHSLSLKAPLQVDNFFITFKEGTVQLVMKAVCPGLAFDPEGEGGSFCRNSDFHSSLMSGSPQVVMQVNSWYEHAKRIDDNNLRSIGALGRNDENSQVNLNNGSAFRPMKVGHGGSGRLADMLEFLQQTFKRLIDFDAATAGYVKCMPLAESSTSARLYSPVLMETGWHLGGVLSSKNPDTKDVVLAESRIMGRKVPNFGVSDPLKPLLEKTWQFLVGKEGFHLGLSQFLSLSMLRNAACLLSTSSPFSGIHGEQDARIGSLLKLSSDCEVQPMGIMKCFHVKKRRRSDKALTCGILPEIVSMEGNSVGCHAQSKSLKRKKCNREWASADAYDVCRITHTDGCDHESTKSSPEEVGPFMFNRCQSNSLNVSRASRDKEFSAWFTSDVSDRENLEEAKEFGSSAGVPSPLPFNADAKSDTFAREFTSSFQPSEHGAYASSPEFSDRTSRDAGDIEMEDAQNFNSIGKRPLHQLELGGAIDSLSYDRRKCYKTGSSFTFENELDVSGESFGRSDIFFENSPGKKGECSFDNMQYHDFEAEPFSCTANILFAQHDRSWRELGARVELLLDGSTWVLSVCHHGESLFTYKAEQSMTSGSSNKYTHAMMWKGGKDWSLEFEKRQWSIFKEMHHICFLRNTRVAIVRHIPVPGVSHTQENAAEDLFVQPEHYILQKQGELEAVLSCSRSIYDMDSEDEEWLAQANEGSATVGTISGINDDTLEALIEKLERTAYNRHDMLTVDAALELCHDLGPPDVVRAVHAYWVGKRLRKGMPLVRHFQPAPWQRYQKQLQEWEARVKTLQQVSHLSHRTTSSAFPQRPPWFAFCLRPRGLEIPNKFQKQRSQKKLGFVGTARHWTSAISMSFTSDDPIESPVDQRHVDEHPEEPFSGSRKSNSLDVKGASAVLGGKVRPGNIVDGKFLSNVTGLKLLRKSFGKSGQNRIGKRVGRKPKKKRIHAADEDYVPKGRGKSQKRLHLLETFGRNIFEGAPATAATVTPSPPLSRTPLECINTLALNSDSSSIAHLEIVAEATDFARKAADAAARKRGEAQALYVLADAAMCKAVSAVIAAEAIEAEERMTMSLIGKD